MDSEQGVEQEPQVLLSQVEDEWDFVMWFFLCSLEFVDGPGTAGLAGGGESGP